ncbi:MAG: metallophosphoesterase [Nitrospinota bacterium]|nr:metallophosphoesterase [Nitrospinota bacterium]
MIRFLLFLLIFSTVYFGIHYLVYYRIVNDLRFSEKERKYLRIFMYTAAASFMLGHFFMRIVNSNILFYFGSVWLGAIGLALGLFILRELFLYFFPEHPKELTIITLVLTLFLSLLSIYNASGAPTFKELHIPVKNLPKRLEGYKVVLLSDLHLTRFKSVDWLKNVVEMVNGVSPAVIVITGDLIDDDPEALKEHIDVLKKLKARRGKYAVAGNHEFYVGIEKFEEFLKQSKIHVLRNETKTVSGKLLLMGIDDPAGNTYRDYETVLKAMLTDDSKGKIKLLLSHRPDPFDKAAELGIDITLAGHMHAGQIPPMSLLVKAVMSYPFGYFRNDGSSLYTTSGTSTWGPPMRLGTESEIVLFVFEPAGK